MKKLFLVLLAISLGANGWLLWRRTKTAPAAGGAQAAARTVEAKTEPILPLAGIDSTDAAALVDILRAAGADDATLRALYEGTLKQWYRERLAAAQIERQRTAWWREGTAARNSDAALLKAMVTEPLRRLGRDPLELAEAGGRYAFLRAETQRRLAEIELDYADLMGPAGVTAATAQLRTEAAEASLVAEQRRKDILAALTAEERAEYDLRFSGVTSALAARFKIMPGATEQEYRTIKPIIDEFQNQAKALPRDDYLTTYPELQRVTAQKLVEALGYDRAMEYVWSGDNGFYALMQAAVRDGHLTVNTPRDVMDLVIETGQRAYETHANPALTLAQKQAAFAELQRNARQQLDALLPAEVQHGLPASTLNWLTGLSQGRYLVPTPSLVSSNGSTGGLLTSKAGAKPDAPSLPVRPAAK